MENLVKKLKREINEVCNHEKDLKKKGWVDDWQQGRFVGMKSALNFAISEIEKEMIRQKYQ